MSQIIVPSSNALLPIASVTPTGIAVVDITGIPTYFKELLLTWKGISNNTTLRKFQIQMDFGDGLGTNIVYVNNTTGTTPGTVYGNLDIINSSTSLADTAACSGHIRFFSRPANAPVTYDGINTTDGIGAVNSFGGASLKSSQLAFGSLQGLRFMWDNTGNFDGGTITLQGGM